MAEPAYLWGANRRIVKHIWSDLSCEIVINVSCVPAVVVVVPYWSMTVPCVHHSVHGIQQAPDMHCAACRRYHICVHQHCSLPLLALFAANSSQACTWSITVLRDADMKPHLGWESGASMAARNELRPGSRAFLLCSVRAAATGRSVARPPSSILAVAPVIVVGMFHSLQAAAASHFGCDSLLAVCRYRLSGCCGLSC